MLQSVRAKLSKVSVILAPRLGLEGGLEGWAALADRLDSGE